MASMIAWHSDEFDEHEQVCAFSEPETGLRAITAIHSTRLGPAIGGTRFFPYANDGLALDDALRLSRAMSYKCALAGLNWGGGKAVIIGDPRELKTEKLLHAYGRMLNRIGTCFATAEDVGMSVADMEIIKQVSPYVAGTASAGAGDPSVHTAKGVVAGLRAVIETRFGKTGFAGIKIAIQGLGGVGWAVAALLHEARAQLTVSDIRAEKVNAAVEQFGAHAEPVESAHRSDVDIFTPCAMGGIINRETFSEIKAAAVAGAANNQLAAPEFGIALRDRGILFAPDYVINAGGVIGGVAELSKIPGRMPITCEDTDVALGRIHDRLLDIFAQSEADHLPPEAIAANLARRLIGRHPS